MKKKNNNLLYDVHETPPMGKRFILAFQHVFAMFGATILVPITVNKLAGGNILSVPVTLFASGMGTLIYILCTKGKSPVYLGSSFAFITPMVLAYAKSGQPGVLIGIMGVGLFYVLVALIVHFTGKEWLDKVLSPIVVGPMIMIIGLSLAPTAVSSIGIAEDSVLNWKNIVVAVVTFLVTAIIALRGKKFLRVIPFLIGILTGYILSVCLGIVDFTPVKEAAFFSVPKFVVPFASYKPNFRGLLTILPVALVSIAEHVGDHTVLGTIINKNLLQDPGLDRTLMGDGLATFAAGLIGGPANTTYGENTSVVGMTKVASVKVLKLAAIIAMVFAFFGKFTALLETIPSPVLGGVSLLLYGFIAVNGLRVLVENQVDFTNIKNVIVSATMFILGLGGAVITIKSGDASVALSGMSLAAIIGILLNLLLKEEKAS